MLYSASQQRDVEWRPFPEMGEARCAHGLALGDSGYLYACGGYGGGTTYLNTIEYIDAHRPDERGWRPCCSLERARAFGACCTGPDHCLYILGGTDNGSTGFSSCLKWDPRSATSHHLAPMSSSRHAFAASFAPDGKLYVAGGFEYVGTPLRSAECYEPVADKWQGSCPSSARAWSSARECACGEKRRVSFCQDPFAQFLQQNSHQQHAPDTTASEE